PSGGIAEHDFGPGVPRSLELEYSGNDFAAKHVLARRVNSAASLSGETAGDLARSPRWDEVLGPVGIGDVAAVACRDALGCWGWIAINLRAASATETFSLLCCTYALSQRERAVVALLVAGLDTRAVTERLFISAPTVQDHLKSVFDKIGIHSRRELLAKLSSADAN